MWETDKCIYFPNSWRYQSEADLAGSSHSGILASYSGAGAVQVIKNALFICYILSKQLYSLGPSLSEERVCRHHKGTQGGAMDHQGNKVKHFIKNVYSTFNIYSTFIVQTLNCFPPIRYLGIDFTVYNANINLFCIVT